MSSHKLCSSTYTHEVIIAELNMDMMNFKHSAGQRAVEYALPF